MNAPKQILLAHTDAHLRHMLAMLLKERGADVTEAETFEQAVGFWPNATFDLALLGGAKAQSEYASFLKMALGSRSDFPVIGLVEELKADSISDGIRDGFMEILPLRTDPKPVVNRVLYWLGEPSSAEPSAEELAEVEETLAQLESPSFKPAADPELTSQRDILWRGLRELHLEQEIMTAARLALMERTESFASARAKFELDRRNLEREMETMRAEANDLDRSWRSLEQQQQALVYEKQSLSKMEQDLRSQEEFVKTMAPFPVPAAAPVPRLAPISGTATDLERGWSELERAREALQAERSMFRDERMVLVDMDQQIRKKEARLKDLAEQIQDLDRQRKGLPPPPPKVFAKSGRPKSAPRKSGLFKSLLGGRA